jgi:hypothetical protein
MDSEAIKGVYRLCLLIWCLGVTVLPVLIGRGIIEPAPAMLAVHLYLLVHFGSLGYLHLRGIVK